jgi:hypothetical protein
MKRILALAVVAAMVAACGGSGGDADPEGGDSASGATTTTAAPGTTQPGEEAPDDEDEPGEEEPDAPSSPDPDLEPAGDTTVSVDGTPLVAEFLLRCIPFGDGDDDLDLTVLGEGFMLFIYVRDGLPTSHELSIQGTAVGSDGGTGVFSGAAYEMGGSWSTEMGESLDGPPFEYTGDRVSGSLVIMDIRDESSTIEVVFDARVPSDIVDCSL